MSKKSKIILILAIFFFVGALVFAGASARRIPLKRTVFKKSYAASEVLVKFKQGIDLAAIEKFAAGQSLRLKKQYKLLSKMMNQELVLLKSSKNVDAEELAKMLRGYPNVEYANPNYKRFLAVTDPNDLYYNLPYRYLWGLNNVGQNGGTNDADIDAPEAWDISTGSSSVVVAVIDTGFDYIHPDLAANAWKNPGETAGNGVDDDKNGYIDDVYGIDPCGAVYTANNPDTDPMDGYGHGTHCAGSIGGRGNNSLGVVGVNWNVKIMGLKFFDDAGDGGYDADSIECIQYAVYQKTHGQNVVAINASWGGYETAGAPEPIDALRNAIEISTNAGIVFCAASGNGNGDADAAGDDNDNGLHHYPSDYTLAGIIAVAATDRNDALGSFSNFGAVSCDLGAPGVAIMSTIPPIYVPQAGDIFFDNVENGAGNWRHYAASGDTDYWAITENQEGFLNANFPVPSPTHFWSDRPGANYANSSETWLVYEQNIDLSGYVGQDLYLGIGSAYAIDVNDHGYVEISGNGGTSWYPLEDFTDSGFYWSSWSWLIPDAYKTTQFRMRFRLTSDNTTNWIGWLIDNIGIGLANTYYDSWNGTSMATPHVAGAVAYLASIFPSETVAQRKERILYGGDDIPSLHTTTLSGNRLNLFGAYEYTPAAGPSIAVTSPNGGEVWMIGTSHNIAWTTTGTVGNVGIYYSLNSGVSWTSVVTNTANDGVHSWTVPTVTPSTNCLIRIWENSDHEPSDTSDTVFSIIASTTETISTPNTPSGPATGMEGVSYSYTTGGSSSSSGHSIQYRLDWGDGTYSIWLPVGTLSAAHSWSASGTYNVRAVARCSTHFVESAWSALLPVILDETPTWVAVSRFGACHEESRPAVEWHTASEMGAVGFALFRQDNRTREFELVNPNFLPALPNSPQGGIYRLADPGAFPGEPTVYQLAEIDARGRSLTYGPFSITFGAWPQQDAADPGARMGKEEPGDVYGYQRFPREQSLTEKVRLQERRLEQQRGMVLAAGQKNERARITVKGRGLFYVTAGQIARSLGLSKAVTATLIGRHNLKLTGLGREIAWLADANGAGLFFYNEGKETDYFDKNVYFLEGGNGLAMQTVRGGNAGTADSGQSYVDSPHFEGNQYPLLISSMDPAGDIWFWDYVVAGVAAKPFTIQVPGIASTGMATLRVALQGATDTAAGDDHHAVVALNGREIGDATWGGAKAHAFKIEFDAALLQEGGNTISVSGALDTGAPYSVFYVESFDLSYPRYYRAVGNSLICRGGGNPMVTVVGLTEPQALVLDITAADRPRQVIGVSVDVSGRVTFVPRDPGATYLVNGLNAALRPLAVVGDKPAKLKDAAESAEYVVIAPEEFGTAAKELTNYRKKKGLKTRVVSLEDIYDAFSFGVPSPYAIRDFLAFAHKKWSGDKVRYAVLAGKGTYDYIDYQGHGDNLVPVILGRTPEGLCAADKIFGDVTGKDGVPEIAIGRLPALTSAELKAMIDKVKAYENGQGAWLDKALMIADNADSGGDFAAGCNELAGLATGMQAEKIYLAGSTAETRARIIAAWNAGAGLVNYCGHAGISQLAVENIFDVAAAAALRNGDQLPLAVMLTCAAGRFELPGYTSLGEALLLNADGGMAGGLMPSGAALHSDSMRLAEEFYKAVFAGKAATVGTALRTAMKNYMLQGGKASLLNVYNWLGDPAVAFK